MEQEDIKWKQMAKVEWLRNGDKNTKYYHACVRQRQRRYTIEKIHDDGGRLCLNQGAIEKAFVGFL